LNRQEVGRYPADMDSHIAVLEQIARTAVASLERIERRLDAMEGRFTGIDRRFDALNSEHRADFRWSLGLILAQTGALLSVMAHGFHWL
jgi:phage shock protein A